MEQRIRMTSLLLDIRTIGGIFYFPIVVSILGALYVYIMYSGYDDPYALLRIRSQFGVFSLPFVSVWIFSLYQDLVESDGKESLLSLPYKDIEFGLFRVLRMTFLYILLFFVLFFFLIVTVLPKGLSIIASDIYLPLVSILYFSALSFLIIVLVRNVLISYAVIGIYSIFQYMTRGGYSFSIYPFQWPFPHPMLDNAFVGLLLIIFTVIFYIIAQTVFRKRDFLMK